MWVQLECFCIVIKKSSILDVLTPVRLMLIRGIAASLFFDGLKTVFRGILFSCGCRRIGFVKSEPLCKSYLVIGFRMDDGEGCFGM